MQCIEFDSDRGGQLVKVEHDESPSLSNPVVEHDRNQLINIRDGALSDQSISDSAGFWRWGRR